MDRPRIGVIGAGRRRQGLGRYIVRYLSEAGADVTAISCATGKSLHETETILKENYRIQPHGYLSAEDLLRHELLDAVVIASPTTTHGEYLELALSAGLHTLCEKPFVYDSRAPTDLTQRIVAGFRKRNKVLLENVQWPYALTAFRELHPKAFGPGLPVKDFHMLLCPSGEGIHLLVESLSHPISLLQAIAPGDQVAAQNIQFSSHDAQASHITLRFDYVNSQDRIAVTVTFRQVPTQPRPAFITINGHKADRIIQPVNYSMSLMDNNRTVPLPDPMNALIKDFVSAVAATHTGSPARIDQSIIPRMELFRQIVKAF